MGIIHKNENDFVRKMGYLHKILVKRKKKRYDNNYEIAMKILK